MERQGGGELNGFAILRSLISKTSGSTLVQVDIRFYVHISSICMMWQNEFYLYCNVEAGVARQQGPANQQSFSLAGAGVQCPGADHVLPQPSCGQNF